MNVAERQSVGLSEIMSRSDCEPISEQTRKIRNTRDLMGQKGRRIESWRDEAST